MSQKPRTRVVVFLSCFLAFPFACVRKGTPSAGGDDANAALPPSSRGAGSDGSAPASLSSPVPASSDADDVVAGPSASADGRRAARFAGADGSRSSLRDPPPQGAQDLRFVSYNGKHWGRKGQDLRAAASLLSPLSPDVVALQEVNTGASGVEAVKGLASFLTGDTGERYCAGFSPVPSDSRERYALLWKESSVAYVTTQGNTVAGCPALDVALPLFSGRAEAIVREPAYGVFHGRRSGARFLVATVHLVPSGKRPQDEVAPLFASLPGAGDPLSRVPSIIVGDFNLSAAHPAFDVARRAGFSTAMARGVKTSLRSKKREFNKEYDLMFARGMACAAGEAIDVFAAFPGMPAKELYASLSDHAPITTTCRIRTDGAPGSTAAAPGAAPRAR